MTTLKNNIQAQDTQTLFDCYMVINGTKMAEHGRLTFALITDELEDRGVLVYDDEAEEYTFCA